MEYKAAFYVKSPLQYLNALEAKTHFSLPVNTCLLVVNVDTKNYRQLCQLIDRGEWGGVVSLYGVALSPKLEDEIPLDYLHPVFKNNLFSILKLSSIARKCKSLERVFIGDARNPLMQHFANKVGCREVFLLDDGVGSRTYAQWRMEGWHGEEFRIKKKINRLAKSIFLGLRDGLPKSVTFFSAYDIDLPAHDRLIKNTFNVLRGKFSEVERCEAVFFLGSSYVEAGILTEDEYLSQLDMVKDYFLDTTVVYVSHRREKPGDVKKIGEKFKWETVSYDYPIEYQIALYGPYPQKVASFISTGLENCQLIFGQELPIVSFRFSNNFFSIKDTERGKSILNLFEYYQSVSDDDFKVVCL